MLNGALNFQISRVFIPLPRRACSKQLVSVWRSVGRASERAHPLIRMKVPPPLLLHLRQSWKWGRRRRIHTARGCFAFPPFCGLSVGEGRAESLPNATGRRARGGREAVGYIHSIPSPPPSPSRRRGGIDSERRGRHFCFLAPLPVSPAHYF